MFTLPLPPINWYRSRNPLIFIPRPTTPPTPSRGLAKYRRETTMTEWWGDGCTLYGCPRETDANRKIHQYLYLGPPPHQHHFAALQNIAAKQRWRSDEKTVVHSTAVHEKLTPIEKSTNIYTSARHPTNTISRPCKVSPRDSDNGVVRNQLYTLRLSTRN